MRRYGVIVLAASCAMSWCVPAKAQSQGRLSAGIVLLRHDTNLKVEQATDYDGSDRTAEQRARDWDVLGSTAGARISYDFSKLLTLYGEGGIAQATVRDKDVADVDQNVDSRGLDDGSYFAGGVRMGGDFNPAGRLFWQIGGTLSVVSTSLEEDITTSWDYDETKYELAGKIGTWTRPVGLYGGVRFVHLNADLDQTDLTNLPGLQTRTTELGRDEGVDLLLGAQTRGSDVSGFAEIGLVGTFSANAGLTVGF